MHRTMLMRGMIARLGIRPRPLALTYEVTWRCNLACLYCDRHTPMPLEMTRDQVLSALQEFHALGMCQTHLDGGDPLMHRHITRLELLAEHTRFHVVLSAVIGSTPRKEVLQVVDFALSHGFSPRVLLLHEETGRIGLSPEQRAVYADVKRRLGRAAKEAHDYRDHLI